MDVEGVKDAPKTFSFTGEELQCIYYWYLSASGESASGISVTPREHIIDGPVGDQAYEDYRKETIKTGIIYMSIGLTSRCAAGVWSQPIGKC